MSLKISGNIINGHKRTGDYVFQGRFKLTCLVCRDEWFVQGSVGCIKCPKCGCDAVSVDSVPPQQEVKT